MVIALILMGARPEPYLPAVLHSLDGAVDACIVNDNSQLPRSHNRAVLEASALWARGAVEVVEAPFVHFSDARNRCLDALRKRSAPPTTSDWIIMVDCDEVHGHHLQTLTRRILPRLPAAVGVVDSYFVQFMHAFDWFLSVDRRHNLLYRYNPELAYRNEVHEHLHGVRGRRVCVPYVYYHYGYVTPARHIVDKWSQYNRLGDPSYDAGQLADMGADQLFDTELPRVMPYTWPHPRALAVLDRTPIMDPAVERFRRQAAAFHARFDRRLQAGLRKTNYRVRRLWRAVQTMPMVPASRWFDLLAMTQ